MKLHKGPMPTSGSKSRGLTDSCWCAIVHCGITRKALEGMGCDTSILTNLEAQLSLTNRPMLVHADVPCCAVKNCPLVNDCDLLAVFSDFYLPLSHLTPSMRGIPSSYQVHILCGKTRLSALQPRSISIRRANALRRAAKTEYGLLPGNLPATTVPGSIPRSGIGP